MNISHHEIVSLFAGMKFSTINFGGLPGRWVKETNAANMVMNLRMDTRAKQQDIGWFTSHQDVWVFGLNGQNGEGSKHPRPSTAEEKNVVLRR